MLFTFPSRYWSTIGLTGVFSLTGWSRQIHAEFLVLRTTQDTNRLRFASRTGLSPSTAHISIWFQSLSSCHILVLQPRGGIATTPVWALPRSLATTRGIINLFSLPTGTKMFQFPALASLYSRMTALWQPGCPIRKSPDQRSFAPTRSLSQLVTSFIASVSQGIRHVPFPTSFTLCRSLCFALTRCNQERLLILSAEILIICI